LGSAAGETLVSWSGIWNNLYLSLYLVIPLSGAIPSFMRVQNIPKLWSMCGTSSSLTFTAYPISEYLTRYEIRHYSVRTPRRGVYASNLCGDHIVYVYGSGV
jgi:hypothetical protein